VSDAERRSRLAVRHALAPAARAADPVAATRAVAVLHATEPATVYLSLWARVAGLAPADVDRALYDDRSLVKQLAMRRTLFVFPRDLLPHAWASASARVATQQATRLAKEVTAGGLADDGAAWLDAARDAVRRELAGNPDGLTAQELRERLPELQGTLEVSPDKAYGGTFPVGPRALTQLGVEGGIVRGRNDGHWRLSRPRWTAMDVWLGEQPDRPSSLEGYAELVRRWLDRFGPGTREDLRWWLGSTLGSVDHALADVGAVQVELDGGDTGWLLPDALDDPGPITPWAALLPVLDPTVMGWKGRDFFLGPHAASLFDRNGNAGTTAWWNGRVVGCWVQDPDGVVVLELLEDLPGEAVAGLEGEAERLTEWLAGERVSTVYPSPAMKTARDRLPAEGSAR
jgi:DNA glycosylase AlkZ-like